MIREKHNYKLSPYALLEKYNFEKMKDELESKNII